jgi:hypothetical protein
MGWKNPSQIIKYMTKLGYDFGVEEGKEPVIYGIKSQELKKKKFNQDGQWTNLLEAATECYEDAVPEMIEWREDFNFWSRKDDHADTLRKIVPKMDKVPEVIDNYLKECEVHEERKEWVSSFVNTAGVIGQRDYDYYNHNKEIHGENCDKANPWPAKWAAVLVGYPMVDLLLEELNSWGIEDRQIDAMVDYIKMVDRCKNIDSLLR